MIRIACIATLIVAVAGAETAAARPEGVPIATQGLTSTKEHGTITLVADPALLNGRVVLKVVAYNNTAATANFSDDDIHVSTSAGKPVQILSVERLIDEARRAAESEAIPASDHDPSNYSRPEVRHSGVGGSGAMEVNGVAGANLPTSGVVSPYTHTARLSEAQNARLQDQIANLNAAILHPVSIAPSHAEGGQIVTEKPRFGRKDDKTLHVLVNFNGDEHEFDFLLPGAS